MAAKRREMASRISSGGIIGMAAMAK